MSCRNIGLVGLKNGIMLGLFSKVYGDLNLLKFTVPASFKVRIVEPVLIEDLKNLQKRS